MDTNDQEKVVIINKFFLITGPQSVRLCQDLDPRLTSELIIDSKIFELNFTKSILPSEKMPSYLDVFTSDCETTSEDETLKILEQTNLKSIGLYDFIHFAGEYKNKFIKDQIAIIEKNPDGTFTIIGVKLEDKVFKVSQWDKLLPGTKIAVHKLKINEVIKSEFQNKQLKFDLKSE